MKNDIKLKATLRIFGQAWPITAYYRRLGGTAGCSDYDEAMRENQLLKKRNSLAQRSMDILNQPGEQAATQSPFCRREPNGQVEQVLWSRVQVAHDGWQAVVKLIVLREKYSLDKTINVDRSVCCNF